MPGFEAANQIVGATLTEITGESLGDDPDAWLKWWNDKLGLRYERTEARYKKTTVQYVPVPFRVHHSCFAAGTPVPTLTGPRPIESLAVGDVVLSQDTVTGVLSYQPIVGIHHNPPAETVRIRTEGRDGGQHAGPPLLAARARLGHGAGPEARANSIRTAGGRAEVVEITAGCRAAGVQPRRGPVPLVLRRLAGSTWCAITACRR